MTEFILKEIKIHLPYFSLVILYKKEIRKNIYESENYLWLIENLESKFKIELKEHTEVTGEVTLIGVVIIPDIKDAILYKMTFQ